ncbi:uncharacterized protein JCM10292_004498 [Rhodotorula paludigena]|uniref:uncharacterized protein n=1 Tax=Rhodotorula paludigena TaxID=86838 RepID=UPI0031701861
MLARTAARSSRLARPSPSRAPPRRTLATHPAPTQPAGAHWARAGAAATAGILAYTAYRFAPDRLALATPLHADATPPAGVYLDPTTKTPFPSRLTSPHGVPLRLVGTGVRTVSFLGIRVYAAAVYVSEREFDLAKHGTIAGWEGYTPERLIPPFAIPPGDQPDRPKGEELVHNLLEKADMAVVIIPLRNTSLPHLRDGFSRALVARMKNPRVSQEFTDAMNESTGAAMIEFKSFFPGKTLSKGMPLELYYSAVGRSVTFQLRNEETRSPEVLGTLREPILARELMVSYFSNDAAPSSELVKSVAMGFDGAPRE